jgi:hypothetical protein
MKYMYAFRYVFENPKWMANMLAATICILVPIVGPIVLLGYGFEIVEALHRRKESRYPDFDTNRLTEYLMRGVWPWLVQLVASLPISLVVIFLYVCFIAGVALAPDKIRGIVVVVLILLFFLAVVLLAVAITVVLLPLTLRAGLTQDFGQAFSVVFMKDFIKRMWREMILVELFVFASGFVLGLAGMLLCFVGVYPAAALSQLANQHLVLQLYELYLQRGGTPIPLKPDSSGGEDGDLPSVYEEPPAEGIQTPEQP